jgi:hypothetical protein
MEFLFILSGKCNGLGYLGFFSISFEFLFSILCLLQEFDPVKYILDNIPTEDGDAAYFDKQVWLANNYKKCLLYLTGIACLAARILLIFVLYNTFCHGLLCGTSAVNS